MSTRSFQLTTVLAVAAGLMLPGAADAALAVPQPDPPPNANNSKGVKRVLALARTQLRYRVSERKGDNVPRYRNGKGKIAPYSISDAWCVAFATWAWNRAGYRDYLGAKYVRRSYGGVKVAIQVTDMSVWAKQTGHWSARAKPGYLVAYNFSHIGIVTAANRNGRAVWAIEGNKGDRVSKVKVPMANVTGYISPTVLSSKQIINAIANPDMEVPEEIAEDPEAFAEPGTDE